jgi:hypothetical protein
MELIALAITIAIGSWIPVQIDANAAARDRTQLCVTTVLTLRASLEDLLRGYAVDRADKPNRLADWDKAWSDAEVVRSTCDSPTIQSGDFLVLAPGESDGESFRLLVPPLDEARHDSLSGGWGTKSQAAVEGLIRWTGWALTTLPRY